MKNIVLQCIMILCVCAVHLYATPSCESVDKEKLEQAILEYTAGLFEYRTRQIFLEDGLDDTVLLEEIVEADNNFFAIRSMKIQGVLPLKPQFCTATARFKAQKKWVEKRYILTHKYEYFLSNKKMQKMVSRNFL